MRSITLGNNITIDTTFNQKYQVQALDSGSILNRDYTYDYNGNITYINRNSSTYDQPPIYPYSYTDNYAYGTSQPPDCYIPIN